MLFRSQVINYCSGQTQWWDASAAIFADCLDVATTIGKVKFKHCPRMSNCVAHEIANLVFVIGIRLVGLTIPRDGWSVL